MLRRLHAQQPASFEFTPANLAWANGQISKYPEGRQASAIIPLLWRAQEQEGWLSRPAIEHVAQMLGMAYIRALEVATFYFMFHLQPVGTVAHIQVCGTTSCMICGAEDLMAVCKEMIARQPHVPSADGRFSWEEVECLGACANAPMAQIGKDYYEDLTAETLRGLITRFANGELPTPGSQTGRFASEPASGLTSLDDLSAGRQPHNASVQAALDLRDTVKRIDGTEVALVTPWVARPAAVEPADAVPVEPTPGKDSVADASGTTVQEAPAVSMGRPPENGDAPNATPLATPEAKPTAHETSGLTPAAETTARTQPKALSAPRDGRADDLKVIVGIGPRIEALCHRLGVFHFDQIAAWTEQEIAWMDEHLEGFKGRVTRDNWVSQARTLSSMTDDKTA